MASVSELSGTEFSLSLDDVIDDVDPTQLREYKEIFELYDEDGSKTITARELKNAMRRLGYSVSIADVQKMVEMGDLDQDGVVSFPEFVHLMKRVQQMKIKAIVEAFKVFDTDESGFVDVDELRGVLHSLGRMVDDEELQEMVDAADEDGDGEISLAEFVRIMGYDPELADDLDFISSGSSSSGYDEESTAEHVMTSKTHANVVCKSVYLEDSYSFHVTGKTTVAELKELLSEECDHPPDLLRLYHRGMHLEDDGRSLARYEVNGGHNICYLYLPVAQPLPSNRCFEHGSVPDLDAIYKHFQREGRLREKDAVRIVQAATHLLRAEKNLVHVADPVVMVGDIHGQFFDLEEIFSAGGPFSESQTYLFLGDYVDRGYFSCEVILYLLAAKIRYPKNVVLLRGNHECRKTTKKYGTRDECEKKYGRKLYGLLMVAFDHMPLYALVRSSGRRLLAMHGGLSPRIETLNQIDLIHRSREPPVQGPLKDCLWTDPHTDCRTDDVLADAQQQAWDLDDIERLETPVRTPPSYSKKLFHPSIRGPTVPAYGYMAVCSFLRHNDLLCIVRAHEQKQWGYEWYKTGPDYNFPAVITVFSAPNYTDKSMNNGSVVILRDGHLEFVSYKWRMHPIYHDHLAAHNALEKDLFKEDFLQFVNYMQPTAVYRTPFFKLEEDFRDTFVGAGHQFSTESSEDAYASTASSSHSRGDHVIKHDNWGYLHSNATEVLKLSDDPHVRKLYRKKSRAMLLWYDGFDHFAEAVSSEEEFEYDFMDDEVEGEDDFGQTTSSCGCVLL